MNAFLCGPWWLSVFVVSLRLILDILDGTGYPGRMKLEKRVAIVTGASRGVGRSVALTLARAGCDLVLAAKTVEPDPKLPGTLGEVAKEIERLGRKALVVQDRKSTRLNSSHRL